MGKLMIILAVLSILLIFWRLSWWHNSASPVAVSSPGETAPPVLETAKRMNWGILRVDAMQAPKPSLFSGVGASDFIVKGQVVPKVGHWPNPDAPKDLYWAMTFYEFRVDKYFKGNGPSHLQLSAICRMEEHWS